MNSHLSLCSILVLLGALLALLAGAGQEDRHKYSDYSDYEDEELAFGEQNDTNCSNTSTSTTVSIPPTCETEEFLTFNGTDLFCRSLPDVGFCDCPDLIPQPGNETSTAPVAPLPPPGCRVFTPPIRGAFACLRSSNNIYCSVLCDHRFEFSFTPRNPYFCGEDTLFNWRDYPNGIIQDSLPACTGFRHRLRLLHAYKNYLSAPCYGLNDHTIRIILEELFGQVKDGGCEDCMIEDAFIQCPEVEPSSRTYSQVANARTSYK